MLIMNLSVAAVIEGLNSATDQNTGFITKDAAEEFLEIWHAYDPKGTGWVSQQDLVFFLYELPDPFTVKDLKNGITYDNNWILKRPYNDSVLKNKMDQESKDKLIYNKERNLTIS